MTRKPRPVEAYPICSAFEGFLAHAMMATQGPRDAARFSPRLCRGTAVRGSVGNASRLAIDPQIGNVVSVPPAKCPREVGTLVVVTTQKYGIVPQGHVIKA